MFCHSRENEKERKKKMTERELSRLLVVLVMYPFLQVFSVLHCYDVCNWHYVLMSLFASNTVIGGMWTDLRHCQLHCIDVVFASTGGLLQCGDS